MQGRYDDEDEPQYSTFVRIGSGFSFADYVWIRDKPWKVWDPRKPPTWLKTAKKGFDDKGDLYLEPEEYVDFYRVVGLTKRKAALS